MRRAAALVAVGWVVYCIGHAVGFVRGERFARRAENQAWQPSSAGYFDGLVRPASGVFNGDFDR